MLGTLYRSYSQNLVLNPSFEQFEICPDIIAGLDTNCVGWTSANEWSPDYFNECSSDTIVFENYGIPLNIWGYQSARTGGAYVGIITGGGYEAPEDNKGREYVQIELLSSLVEGENYKVSCYVAMSDSNKYASNDIGFLLTNSFMYQYNSFILDYIPNFENNPISNPLDVFNIWKLVEFEYLALGGEKYLTIGSFKSFAEQDTTLFPNANQNNDYNYSYYYIDDVSVLQIVENSIYENNKMPFNVEYYSDYIKITSKLQIKNIQLFDISGRVIEVPKQTENILKINNNISKGVYIVKFLIDDKIYFTKILIT
jgi:OmpA-OmpF porin, OOP family